MDAQELIEVSQNVAQLGGELTELRNQRKSLDEAIEEKEKALEPLLTRHEELIRELRGVPKAPPTPVHRAPPLPPHANRNANSPEMKQRIIKFLETAEPGLSAGEVADALKIDPVVVREAMREMLLRSPTPPQEAEQA
jgi:hypothetical protein